ncbi:hypothetical protein HUG17_0752 [Dermatophagoides farinae]|nr:hypothetical protein HUG17_0752 [Dermatophagoides farinae]
MFTSSTTLSSSSLIIPTTKTTATSIIHQQQQQQSYDDQLRRASWPVTILNNQQQQKQIKIFKQKSSFQNDDSIHLPNNLSTSSSHHEHEHESGQRKLSCCSGSSSTTSGYMSTSSPTHLHHHHHQPEFQSDSSSPSTIISTTKTISTDLQPIMPLSPPTPQSRLQQQQPPPPPPSVVISDHSSMDHIHIHSIIQFDSDSGENDYESSDNNNRRDSLCSIYSSTSSLSSMGDDDDDDDDDSVFQSSTQIETSSSLDETTTAKVTKKSSKWRKVRSLVTSPFIQTYKRKKYPWIQLAGHQGNFVAGQIQGTIMKKLCGNEIDCFEKLMSDTQLSVLVPEFKNIRIVNGDTYLELEDLLATFVNPSVMDIKMGIRTYLEEELVKANEKPRLRKDMYEKMVAIDPDEPSDEEKLQKAITKPRYMVWRETISSTSTLGFRIDGMKSGCNCLKTTSPSVKDFKRMKSVDAVRSAILEFVGDKHEYLITYLEKLKLIRKQLEQSNFFQTHEMIGSSLLFVHDQQHANIWMIDFAKTYPLSDGLQINHRDQWKLGNHEDGYLFGLDNLIQIFSSLC